MKEYLQTLLIIWFSATFAVQAAEDKDTYLMPDMPNYAPGYFAKNYSILDIKVSPSGKYLGVLSNTDGRRTLTILDEKTKAFVNKISFRGINQIRQFQWASNERLAIGIGQKKGIREELSDYGEIYAVNADGTKGKVIFGYRAGKQNHSTGTRIKRAKSMSVWGYVFDPLPKDSKHILVTGEPMTEGLITLYRVNIFNGKVRKLKTSSYRDSNFVLDAQKNLKVSVSVDKDGLLRVFQLINGTSWKEIKKLRGAIKSFRELTISEDGTAIYYLGYAGHNTRGIQMLDLKTEKVRTVFRDPEFDVTSTIASHNKKMVIAYRLDRDFPEYKILSGVRRNNLEADAIKAIKSTFPRSEINIRSQAQDKFIWTFSIDSFERPADFYQLSKPKGKGWQIEHLFSTTKIDHRIAVNILPFSFKSRDGLTIRGLYTPSNSEKINKGLVVLRSGFVQNTIEYSEEIQMLSHSGYSVLTINTRGSFGYGLEFQELGYKHLGDTVQENIIDGVQYALQKKWGTPGKICAMGKFFTGYSAIKVSMLKPELFKCAISLSGFYDLSELKQYAINIGNKANYEDKHVILRYIGTNQQQLVDYSLINHAEKIQTPLLIAWGEQSDENFETDFGRDNFIKKLKKLNKPFETFHKATETDHFYKEAHRAEYYEAVIRFLDKHLNSPSDTKNLATL